MSLVQILEAIRKTNVTKTVHSKPYPEISPTRATLSQAGKTVLITGGGTGAGFAIAQAFVRASAAAVIIIGRRADVLETARCRLEEDAKVAGTGTTIISRTCDAVNFADVDALWEELAGQNIVVNVYVANAAKFTEVKPLFELGSKEVWSQMEANVRSPLYFTEKFHAQAGNQQTFVVNISTASIHSTSHPEVASRPAYTLSKLSGTLLFQLLAQDHRHESMQVVSLHPGLIYNEYWKSLGIDEKDLDSDELTGACAVWAATKEAVFLHGRFFWCSWDVNELASGAVRERLDRDFYYLRASIVGLEEGLSA